jgi:hypothetical protein
VLRMTVPIHNRGHCLKCCELLYSANCKREGWTLLIYPLFSIKEQMVIVVQSEPGLLQVQSVVSSKLGWLFLTVGPACWSHILPDPPQLTLGRVLLLFIYLTSPALFVLSEMLALWQCLLCQPRKRSVCFFGCGYLLTFLNSTFKHNPFSS